MGNSIDTTPNPHSHVFQDVFVDVAIDSWRLSRRFERVVQKLDVTEQRRHLSQLRFHFNALEKSLTAAGLRLVNLEGLNFDPGMAVTIANPNDFETAEELLIDQMLEPVVMGHMGVVRVGKVVLGRRKQCATTSA